MQACSPIHEEKQSIEATQRNLEEVQAKPLQPKDESSDSFGESLGLAAGRDDAAPALSSRVQVVTSGQGCRTKQQAATMPNKIQPGMMIELAEEPEELQKIVIDPPKDDSFVSDGRMASGHSYLNSSEPDDQRNDGHQLEGQPHAENQSLRMRMMMKMKHASDCSSGPPRSLSFDKSSKRADQERAPLSKSSLVRNEEDVLQADIHEDNDQEIVDHRRHYRHDHNDRQEMNQAIPAVQKENSPLILDSSNARHGPASRPQKSSVHQKITNQMPTLQIAMRARNEPAAGALPPSVLPRPSSQQSLMNSGSVSSRERAKKSEANEDLLAPAVLGPLPGSACQESRRA